MSQRPRIASCYDHLSGIAGERLTSRLVELGWVTPEPAPGVTPLGWKGFADLGLSNHLGGHLGYLVRRHFAERGWLRTADGKLELTPEGEAVLVQLGIHLEEQA